MKTAEFYRAALQDLIEAVDMGTEEELTEALIRARQEIKEDSGK